MVVPSATPMWRHAGRLHARPQHKAYGISERGADWAKLHRCIDVNHDGELSRDEFRGAVRGVLQVADRAALSLLVAVAILPENWPSPPQSMTSRLCCAECLAKVRSGACKMLSCVCAFGGATIVVTTGMSPWMSPTTTPCTLNGAIRGGGS